MTTTPTNWSVRPSRRMSVFRSLWGVGAVVMIACAVQPWLPEAGPARMLLAGILGLAVVHGGFAFRNGMRAAPEVVSRRDGGRWRMESGTRTHEGRLVHAWQGWGWLTLRIQQHPGGRTRDVTLWRSGMDAAAWHLLQLWMARDLAIGSGRAEATP